MGNNKGTGTIGIIVGLLVIWGIFGLANGDGFFGGIGVQIDAIGDLVALLLKVAIGIGIIWLILNQLSKDKKN